MKHCYVPHRHEKTHIYDIGVPLKSYITFFFLKNSVVSINVRLIVTFQSIGKWSLGGDWSQKNGNEKRGGL
jgi:hypothetical protein